MLRIAAALVFAFVSLFVTPVISTAQERVSLGQAHLFTNDRLGDRQDRWRSGSYHMSHMYGPAGGIPQMPGQLLEYRFRGEVISPSQSVGGVDDRRQVGMLSFGLHSKWRRAGWDFSAGLDAIAVGPATRVTRFQSRAHKFLSIPQVKTAQPELPNKFYLNMVGEASRNVQLSEKLVLRPFAEIIAGPETLGRVGADVFYGTFAFDAAVARDVVTGHVLPSQRYDHAHLTFTMGADYAAVMRNVWVQPGTMRQDRIRARAGVYVQPSEHLSVFYGATYLSPEFKGQQEHQIVGSMTVNITF